MCGLGIGACEALCRGKPTFKYSFHQLRFPAISKSPQLGDGSLTTAYSQSSVSVSVRREIAPGRVVLAPVQPSPGGQMSITAEGFDADLDDLPLVFEVRVS